MLLLGASFDLCTCGSGLRGGVCCYMGAPAERGPLWEQFHNCQCDNPRHELHNPDVSLPLLSYCKASDGADAVFGMILR